MTWEDFANGDFRIRVESEKEAKEFLLAVEWNTNIVWKTGRNPTCATILGGYPVGIGCYCGRMNYTHYNCVGIPCREFLACVAHSDTPYPDLRVFAALLGGTV